MPEPKNKKEKDEATKNPAEGADETTSTEETESEVSVKGEKGAPAEKKRTIRLLVNHKCNIAGIIHDYKKGDEPVVTENVARILCGSNKAIQL